MKKLRSRFLTKESLKNLIITSAAVFLSALLFMLAFNIFSGSGGSTSQNHNDKKSQSSRKNGGKQDDPKDKNGQGNKNADNKKGKVTPSVPYEKDMNEKFVLGKEELPDIQIDLSKENSVPQFDPEGMEKSLSVQMGSKPRHEPLLEIFGKTGSPYIRFVSFQNFSQTSWVLGDDLVFERCDFDRTYSDKFYKMRVLNPLKGFVPATGNIKGIKFPSNELYYSKDYSIYYARSEVNSPYDVFYDREIPDWKMLKNERIVEVYDYKENEQLSWISSLTREMEDGYHTPYEKIEWVKKLLKSGYTVANKDVLEGTGENRMRAFLHDVKKGTTLDFVSAFTLLLQSMEVQTRVAVGYKIHSQKDYQIVYADQLEVMPEVHFELYGWVPVDIFEDVKTGESYVPPIETETEITDMEGTIKKGSSIKVKGTVAALTRRPVSGTRVLIYVKKTKSESAMSKAEGMVENGKFEVQVNIGDDYDVGSYQVAAQTLGSEKYKESWSDPELKVVDDTFLLVEALTGVDDGKEFSLSGGLYEKSTGKALENLDLELHVKEGGVSFPDLEKGGKSLKGKFDEKMKAVLKEGAKPSLDLFYIQNYKSSLSVTFKGSTYYLPSAYKEEITIWKVHFGRMIVFGVIPLFMLVFLAYFSVKYVKKRRSSVEHYLAVSPHDNMEIQPMRPMGEMFHDGQNITICFPDIKEPFPQVWGKEDALLVRFQDGTGAFEEVRITFRQCGCNKISVYDGDRKLKASRSIQIVEYGEEMIKLGKEAMKKSGKFFGPFHDKNTPREMADILHVNGSLELADVFGKMVAVFEKAAYGNRKLIRGDFENFYILYLQILNEIKRDRN
ncbi:MAG: transglutaminase-like domain-containing protein [Clostridia bacterium]|nr:transglutaminase-like domain-containing protein [Clostridia bacterium]